MENKKVIESYYHSFNEKRYKKLCSLLDEHVEHYINQGEPAIKVVKTFYNLNDWLSQVA
jgi:hypothetical protein